jgi:hypothetical protein
MRRTDIHNVLYRLKLSLPTTLGRTVRAKPLLDLAYQKSHAEAAHYCGKKPHFCASPYDCGDLNPPHLGLIALLMIGIPQRSVEP